MRRGSGVWSWIGVLCGASLMAACDGEATGFLRPCGGDFCNDHEECVTEDGLDECRCLPGYRGLDCHDCPAGYRLNSSRECEQVRLYCERDCGAHGHCLPTERGGECECDAAYDGAGCNQCASGYQDNDGNGTCRPACGSSAATCEFPEVCRDGGGEARCECALGYTGDECSRCALGYQESASGCVLACEAAGLECGPREQCHDAGTTPRCVCLPQYAGADCDRCASGYVEEEATGLCLPTCDALDCGRHGECRDDALIAYCSCDNGYVGATCEECQVGFASDVGGTCTRQVTNDFTLLTRARNGETASLTALDASTGEAIPVSQRNLGGLALGDGQLYATGGASLSSVDLLANELTFLAVTPPVARALAYDSSRGLLYAIGEPPAAPLVAIDPVEGSTSVVGETGLSRVFDLTYDAVGDQLLVWGETLVAVDPTTGEPALLGELPWGTQGLAFDENGTLYASVATDLSSDEAQVEACRKTAVALGERDYGDAPGVLIEPNDEPTVVLEADPTETTQVVAYTTPVSDIERSVTIASDNAESFYCLILREPTLLLVPAAARMRGLVAFTVDSEVQVTVEEGFETDHTPAIHLGSVAPVLTVSTSSVVRLYEPSEWAAAQLPIDPAYFAPGPGQLLQLTATGTIEATVPLAESFVPLGPLSAVRFEDP